MSIAGFAGALVASACAMETADRGSLQSDREVRGDTVVVTIAHGSVWSSTSLVEEIRIGALDGQDEYIFGRIGGLVPDGTGGVYVFDGLAPALRQYDAQGRYVRTLGGDGSGPGEYRDVALGLAVRSDGRLVMRDSRNNRINVYNPDGTASDHWLVASGLFTSDAMVLDTADHLYLKILLEPPERDRPWNIGFLHLDENGTILDSIPPPAIVGEPTDVAGTMRPTKHWARSPMGFTVVGLSGDYSFEIRHPDGQVVRVIKSHAPVALLPEERAELEAWNDWMRETQGEFMTSDLPPVPSTKPAYADIEAGDDGRIWVRRHVTAVQRDVDVDPSSDRPPPRSWIEPLVYDVFGVDGTYLGEVRVPERTQVSWIGRDEIWGVYRGELDEPYVVRLRLEVE